MGVVITCPDPSKLGGLIRGTLPDLESQELTEHIETCSRCQQAIQQQATGEIPIDELVSELSATNPPSDSAYWPVVRRMEKGYSEVSRTTPSALDSDTPGPVRSDSPPGELAFLDPPDDPAYIGKLHQFQISRVLGRGGMGIVFEAFDTHLQRRVAIKVLNPQFQDNDIARQRFCREGRAAAAISHEHVVSMYHVARAQQGEVAYLVMQLIEGETLEQRLAEPHALPAAEVARLSMQIAAGLSAAHSRDMVHRDVKPANILIESETDRVKLTDFGLARATDDIKLTKTGMVTGTPLYMSPEQALGSTADERSDLFSLGAVMYEMATGKSAFLAATAVGVMKRIMDETPEPPHKINASITKPLSDVIMRLLEKEPEDRPESAAAVTAALASIVNEFGPISPLQVPSVAKSEVAKLSGDYCPVRRRWFIGTGIAATAGVIGLLSGLAMWMSSAGSGLNSAGGLASPEPSFPSVVLAGNPGTVWSVDFSPGGNQVAAAIEDGSVRLWDIDARQVVKSFNAHRGIVWMVKFHPTRPIVASCGDDGRVVLWDSETFEPVQEWQAGNAVRGVDFSPDGSRIIAGDREGIIHVYDIDSGDEVASQSQAGAIFGIDYSQDGKLIATVGSDKVVRLWDAGSLRERQSMLGHDGPIYDVDFGGSSPLLATVGWNKNIRIWNVETGTELQNLEGSDGDVWGVAFCGEGTHVVTGGQDSVARIWDLSDGSNIAVLRGHESAVHNISLDHDNYRIATSSRDGTIRVWDLSCLRK